MSHSSQSKPLSLSETKEELEVRKLKAEIDQISQPIWKKTTFWLAAITLGITVPGAFIQWATSTIRFEKAELASQQELKAVNDKLEITRRTIEDERLRARQKLETIKSEARKLSRPGLEMIELLGGFDARIDFEISENDFYMIGICLDENRQPIAAKVELLDAADNILEVVTSNIRFGGLFALRIPEKARNREQYEVTLRLSAEGKKTKRQPLFTTSPYLYRADFRPAK
jgi:hypothetical protein